MWGFLFGKAIEKLEKWADIYADWCLETATWKAFLSIFGLSFALLALIAGPIVGIVWLCGGFTYHPLARRMPAALSGRVHQIWHGLLTGERMPMIEEYWEPPQIICGNAWSNVYPDPEKKRKKRKKKEPFGFYQRKKNPAPLSERGSFCG